MIPFLEREKTPIVRGIVPTRVLVIDSEPLIRWSVCAALASAGFDAIAAADAREAARRAAEWPPPRVALIDLRNPDAEGKELLTALRAVYPACRFLIMTTDPRAVGIDAGRADGVDVIEKPFDLTHIVERIAKLAGERSRQANAS
jgi:DNA-binding NtrC family response regulator